MHAPRRQAAALTVFDLFYGAVGLLAAACVIPVAAWRARRDGAAGARWRGRLALGAVPVPIGNGPRVLFHGVSLGEVKLVAPLLRALTAVGAKLDPLITSTTPAGLAEAERLFAEQPRAVWPIDFPTCPGRFLAKAKPQSVILLEHELWPTFLRQAARRSIPVAVVSGRFSQKSANRCSSVAEVAARRLSAVELFAMQSEPHAERLRRLRVPDSRIVICGNVKFDGLPDPRAVPSAELRRCLGIEPGEQVVVAGSTHGPEEGALARAAAALRQQGLERVRWIFVPRHTQRSEALEQEITSILGPPARLTRLRAGAPAPSAGTPILIDTLGELESVYRFATIAFVGGSLGNDRGGQNMLEPAALGVPVLHGPRVANFIEAAELLQSAGASMVVADEAALQAALAEWLRNPEEAARRGAAGRAALEPHRGASARIARELLDRGLVAR
ncbi:MAG: hypothetical protein JNJ88_08535 [Planctomycetes bacterium]|nr:hypothetical protein [Planctomycetota bacterium]